MGAGTLQTVRLLHRAQLCFVWSSAGRVHGYPPLLPSSILLSSLSVQTILKHNFLKYNLALAKMSSTPSRITGTCSLLSLPNPLLPPSRKLAGKGFVGRGVKECNLIPAMAALMPPPPLSASLLLHLTLLHT